MSRSTSSRAGAGPRRVSVRHAWTNTSGRANKVTMAATTIIVMPHQSDDVLPLCARPKAAVPSATGPGPGGARAAGGCGAFRDRPGARNDLTRGDHDRHDDREVDDRAYEQARCGADDPQAAGADPRPMAPP